METFTLKGKYIIEHKNKDGVLLSTDSFDNLITTVGKAQAAITIGAGTNPFTYLAVGSSATTPNVSDTALNAEITTNGLARALATQSVVTTTTTGDTRQWTYTWTATGTSTINEIGLFNASSGGTIFSHALTTSTKTVNNTDTLTATYQLKLS